MARVCVVGNATKDVNETGLLASRQPGGTLLYASLALHRLGHDVQPIGSAPLTAYLALRRAGVDVSSVRLALRATKFKNTYDGDTREQKARPGPDRALDPGQELQGVDALLLGPVLGELPSRLDLPQDAVSLLDLQGPVRRLGQSDFWGWQEVTTGDPADPLPEVDVLRGSIEELEAWLGTPDPEKAATLLHEEQGGVGVVTMGPEGALAHDGSLHRARPAPVDVDDPTGAGDVFDAGLLHGLLAGEGWDEALLTACATAAAFLEGQTGVHPQRFPTAEEARARLA